MRDFIDAVRERGGFPDDDETLRAVAATLDALGRQLMPTEAALVAEGLPEPLARDLRESTHLGGGGAAAVHASVAAHESVGLGVAKEHVEVVLSAIADRLGAETRDRLRRDLPADLAAAFEPPPSASAPPAARRAPTGRPGGTLAGGRPGGAHPLSEAAPDRTQTHSVANPNPHGATKLSSARGVAQERDDDTIAAGRPGSKLPLSEGGE
jgi:uncharacterized protein (DUF2267 family)